MQECKQCKILKPLTDFRLHQKRYYSKKCKDCLYKAKRQWHQDNKQQVCAYNKMYKTTHKQQIKEHYLKNIIKNRKYQCAYKKKRYYNDLLYKLSALLRNRIRAAFKNKKIIRSKCTLNILGCTLIEFKQHIEAQFNSGMNWENFGQWELDHIISLASACNAQELYELSHYKNIQPLWKTENRIKSASIGGYHRSL